MITDKGSLVTNILAAPKQNPRGRLSVTQMSIADCAIFDLCIPVHDRERILCGKLARSIALRYNFERFAWF
jgi:hypothetical protein